MQYQFRSENKKIPQKRIEENKRNQKKKPAESDVLNLETNLEGVLSDYENINDSDNFITVEKKQIRIANLMFLNSEI